MSNFNLDEYIAEIEDYIGGNVEDQETVDRMALTVFLRGQLTQLLHDFEEELGPKIHDHYNYSKCDKHCPVNIWEAKIKELRL